MSKKQCITTTDPLCLQIIIKVNSSIWHPFSQHIVTLCIKFVKKQFFGGCVSCCWCTNSAATHFGRKSGEFLHAKKNPNWMEGNCMVGWILWGMIVMKIRPICDPRSPQFSLTKFPSCIMVRFYQTQKCICYSDQVTKKTKHSHSASQCLISRRSCHSEFIARGSANDNVSHSQITPKECLQAAWKTQLQMGLFYKSLHFVKPLPPLPPIPQ